MFEAVKFYKMAADQGHAHAQYNLPVRHKMDAGVAEDMFEAVKSY